MAPDDDQLIGRLREYLRPKIRRDPVMLLPKARPVVLAGSDLGGFDDPPAVCRSKARRARLVAGGQYGIDVAVPEMIACVLPRGHAGCHSTAPAATLPGRGQLLQALAAHTRRGRTVYQWD